MFSFIGIHLEEFICEARGNLLQGASYFLVIADVSVDYKQKRES